MAESFAPYNFIPFPEKWEEDHTGSGKKRRVPFPVPIAYKNKEELPNPVQFDFNNGLKSGYIEYSVKNLTPIAIGREGRKGFCQDGRGRYIIPGSTMRGFVRSHAEILSFAYPEMIDNQRYLYRKIAGNCIDVRDKYQKNFDINANASSPSKAKAGWLYQGTGKDRGRWFIQPVKEFVFKVDGVVRKRSYLPVREEELIKAGILKYDDRQMMARKDYKYEPYGLRKEFGVIYSGRKREPGKAFNLNNGRVSFPASGRGDCMGGLMNSAYMRDKKRHLIVSLEKDTDVAPIEIPADMIEDYKRDLERTKKAKRLQDGSVVPGKLSSIFYTLPQAGEEKICFYLERDKNEIAEYNKKKDNDVELLGFGPTQYFRIPFEHKTGEGLMVEKPLGIDYVRALFGYADSNDAYKSRLSFQNAVYTIPAEEVSLHEDKVVLNSPQGTAFHIYLETRPKEAEKDKDKRWQWKSDIMSYNDDGFKLRGTKFYWKRSDAVVPSDIGKNQDIYTTLYSIPVQEKDTSEKREALFKGRIYFTNLREDELGLVLMSLRFFDSGKESYMLGGGKPYGFGKVEIKDVKLNFFEVKDFLSVDPEDRDIDEEAVCGQNIKKLRDSFIETMDAFLKEAGIQYGSYGNVPSIKVYKELIRMDNADSYLGNNPNYVYMKPGKGNDLVPGYANYYPLATAEMILNQLPKQELQKSIPEKEERIVWLGAYKLSGEQRNLLNKKTGLRVMNERGATKVSAAIIKYAVECTIAALPSDATNNEKEEARKNFEHVWIARRTGRKDNGWEKMQ